MLVTWEQLFELATLLVQTGILVCAIIELMNKKK